MKIPRKRHKHNWELIIPIASLLVFCAEEAIRHVAWKKHLTEATEGIQRQDQYKPPVSFIESSPMLPENCFNCACRAAKMGAVTQTEKWLVLLFSNARPQERDFWYAKAVNDPDLMAFWGRLGEGAFGYASTNWIRGTPAAN